MLMRTGERVPAPARRHGTAPDADGAAPPTGGADRLRDAVVTVLGILGLVVVTWLIVAWMLSLSVVVLVTGSMSPTMPAGSAAVVQKSPPPTSGAMTSSPCRGRVPRCR